MRRRLQLAQITGIDITDIAVKPTLAKGVAVPGLEYAKPVAAQHFERPIAADAVVQGRNRPANLPDPTRDEAGSPDLSLKLERGNETVAG